ncbi:hypothetical protein [Caulobacter sp. NIBR2454]|uniref:hypothetical protein n=1 Tax=Caulobacter sp. NIBR2454 TaxID=3015996 RepID=UPI0022B71159|nr:hypothetical protein [Caulobacter sp. NIBR2454]
MARRTTKKAPPATQRVPVLEWMAAVLGGLMALLLLALVLIDARRQHEPPVLVVEAREIASTAGGWRVLFEVRNEGGETAAQVQVIGALASGEEAHAVIDDVPGRSSAEGGLFFSEDPRAGRLALRAEGFIEP